MGERDRFAGIEFPDRGYVLRDELLRTKFGARFDPAKFDQLVDGPQGYNLVWARALMCSCRSSDATRNSDASCAVCGGLGVRFVHPDPERFPEDLSAADGSVGPLGGVSLRGIIGHRANDTPGWFDRPGRHTYGDAELTLKGGVRVGYQDRFVVSDALIMATQVLRSEGTGSTVAVGIDPEATLRFPAVGIHHCGSISPLTRYRERTDFTVDDDGQLVFVVGRGPAAGVLYSLSYSCRPVYRVVDFPRAFGGFRASPKTSPIPGIEPYVELPITATVKLQVLGR